MPYSVSYTESVQKAEQAIHAQNFKAAVDIYTALMKRRPSDEHNYSRLMMIFRKLKQPRKELQVINEGIKSVSAAYHSQGQQQFGNNATVKRISNALLKSLGMKDQKGRFVFEPSVVERWKKRKALVLKRMKKAK
ncbi:hypothetical protein I5907_13210 [Panacibacter sp. DH6]|uniref:Uncharacterized protein n=1 Tax=Panacibacter microcysteis TaxID=2793269 RepID=A0A931E892_9BACT|nr:hypothetical protein [Panacibacter microcysteis]MBG9377196.1 hypothetical protein [Panacibacter microcysteis]